MLLLFGLCLAGFAASSLLVPVMGLAARRSGFYSQPRRDRWHERPVPNLGGVAMVLAFLAVLWVTGPPSSLQPLIVTVALMFLVGLVDDLHPIRATTKLVCQVSIAVLLLFMLPPITLTGLRALDSLLALTWVVGITNAFNLLDNIDGLAAGVAAIAGTCLVALMVVDHTGSVRPLAAATAALVGVALGFLLHNFKPASIFMGDGGSHLLGSSLGAATLLATQPRPGQTVLAPIVPVFLLLVPILDTALVTLTRSLAGRSAFSGGRDHVSHRLVALGMSERQAVLLLYGLAVVGGCVAVGLQLLPAPAAWGLAALYVVALLAVGTYVASIEPSGAAPAEAPARPVSHRPADLSMAPHVRTGTDRH